MGLINEFLGKGFRRSEHPTQDELRAIYNEYTEQWPGNNDHYMFWKPNSLLPAPKWVVKRAMKLGYAEWPGPIDETVFDAFLMEFADLALHLPQKQYDAIERFRKQRMLCGNRNDPLLRFKLHGILSGLYHIQGCEQYILRVRDSPVWDSVDAPDHELGTVRQIVLESTTEFAALIQEWRFYILSIGRDQYVASK